MPTNPASDGFLETTELPHKRQSRQVTDLIWSKLAESAKRGVAFTKQGSPAEIDTLRKDLGAAVVKAKYDVTMESKKVSDKIHSLKFSAVAKETETAETPETADTAS